jgi:hypothetical protein
VRKTSDIAMLLGSRGKSRSRGSRGGFGSSFFGAIDGLLGRFGRSRRKDKGQTVPMLVFAIGLMVAFGGGFLVGDRLGGGSDDNNPLNARIGQKPNFVKEVDTTALEDRAFIVTAYPLTESLDEAGARQKASDLAAYLVQHGLPKARPYPWPRGNGVIWVTAVYFSGEAEEKASRDRLLNMPNDVPDELFCKLRIEDSQWPTVMKIR